MLFYKENGVGWQNEESYGGPGGCSEGSFAPFLMAMQVSGERTDVKPFLMAVGGGHQAAGQGGSRSPSVCLMSDEKRCCAVTSLNHVSLSKNTDANEVNRGYRGTAADSITSELLAQITAQSSNAALCT